ncbi:DNA cytosine methyltransferase [Streptomyces sp. NBC_01537]|uniref:DNA cytosine methyltransferase n=1 Tax=Streptomyces sp. NBC_01537 TaxID=2903896 RepID=UPI00386A8057
MGTARASGAGRRFTSLEICAGAGGAALGLERAGFDPVLLIENRSVACETLRTNRPEWHVLEKDLIEFLPDEHPQCYDVDLVSAGLPRVKAAAAVSRRRDDAPELELLKATAYLMHAVQPKALLIENVPDLATKVVHAQARRILEDELEHLGYRFRWQVVESAEYGVPQKRELGLLIAFKGDLIDAFELPEVVHEPPSTVGQVLSHSMAARGWTEAPKWVAQADRVAPTIVGGSWERGGPDLGPSGAKRSWARMGVDGGTVADDVPAPDFHWDPALGRRGMMPLTVDQVALLQGFPPDWYVAGKKTARYRQVGNAMPPPVAEVLGHSIAKALAVA